MSVLVQESLLDVSDEPVLGSLDGSVRRTTLARGAWVDLRRGWLTGSGAVFGRLVQAVPWRAEKRQMYDKVVAVPRLLCFYGEDAPLPDPVLTAARQALNAHYGPELGEPFRTAGLCLYRDGRDSVAWHGDTIGRGRTEDTMVAILSLGTPRPLLLRPRGARGGRPPRSQQSGRAAAGPRCGSRSGTATCWSWAAAVSAPGSTPCRRPPSRPGRGSACSSARAGCADATWGRVPGPAVRDRAPAPVFCGLAVVDVARGGGAGVGLGRSLGAVPGHRGADVAGAQDAQRARHAVDRHLDDAEARVDRDVVVAGLERTSGCRWR